MKKVFIQNCVMINTVYQQNVTSIKFQRFQTFYSFKLSIFLNVTIICSNVLYLEYESEPEASEFDLGTKIRTPKDIMLEELSLAKNRGSKMFRMRQQRVEKFIYENNPDIFSSESMVRT